MHIYSHPDCAEHRPLSGHPESPQRLAASLSDLDGLDVEIREAPLAEWGALERAHAPDHIAAVRAAAPTEGLVHLDPDTAMSPGSLDAALRAAGAAVAAVDAVAAGETRTAFCAVRPPGHHAEPGRAMGFCLFNAAAVAAFHARAAHGFERVAAVDFDVHHGNGTQAAFWDDAQAFYASTHQWPYYPGTGASDERGAHDNIVNAPLAAGADGDDFRRAMETSVLPALDAFEPDFLIVSAGFDAHAHDPLGGLRLTEDDFAWASDRLCEVAAQRCGGRVVSLLEGGYDLTALARCVRAHVSAMAGAPGS